MNAELNASYKTVLVTVCHLDEQRLCRLYIIVPVGKEPIYFLKDYYGWVIDDMLVIREAVEKYSTGLYELE